MAGLHATREGEEEAPDVMAQPLPPASACGCDLLLQLPLHGRRRRRRQRQWRHPVPPLGLHSSPLLLLVVALALLARPTLAVDFTFTWPTPSYQCYPLTMTWQGGSPPYQAVIAPALQLPFVYKIPASACAAASGQCAYTIDMQLNSGFQYVLMLGDANGVGTGGSTALNYVQGYQHAECLATVAQNASSLNTSVMVDAPNPVQCSSGFVMSWDEGAIQPNNFTVISTDQTFDPFDVTIPNGLASLSYDWQVSVPMGKQFMIMWNTLGGYGHGGVSGLYRVNATATGNGTACLPTQPAVKPTSTTTMPTDVSTSPITPTQTSTDGSAAGTAAPGEGGGGPGISTAAVTVIAVIGAAIGIALAGIVAFCFFVVRRRRRNALERQGRGDKGTGASKYVAVGGSSSSSSGRARHGGDGGGGGLHEVDLMDGASSIISPTSARGGGQGHISSSRAYRAVPSGTLTPFGTEDGVLSPTVASSSSPGFAGFGAAGAAASIDADRKWQPHPSSAAAAAAAATTESDFVDSPMTATNPFDASPLNAEDAAAALAFRGGSHGDRRPSYVSSPSSLSAYELQDQHRRQSSGPSGAAPLTRTKSQEAAEELIDVESSQDRTEAATRTTAAVASAGGAGGFRITNASDRDPADLARHTPPPASQQQSMSGVPVIAAPTRRTAGQRAAYQQPRFVRHADAGRVDNRPPPQEEEVIDLPPLYTDLVREEQDSDRRATSPRSDDGR